VYEYEHGRSSRSFTGSLVSIMDEVPRVVGKVFYSCSGPKDPYAVLHSLHSFKRAVCLIKPKPCGGELFNTTFHTVRKRREGFNKADRSGNIVGFGGTTLRIPIKLILCWSPLRKLPLGYTKLGPAKGFNMYYAGTYTLESVTTMDSAHKAKVKIRVCEWRLCLLSV
jgi:hypothetical protein